MRVNKTNALLVWIFLLFPLVLFSNLFYIRSEEIETVLKLVIFISMVSFIPFSRIVTQMNLLNLLVLMFIVQIIAITLIYGRAVEDLLYALLYIFPFLLLLKKEIKFPKFKLIVAIYIYLTFFALIYVLINPHDINAGKKILAILHHGPHTSSYSIALLFFLLFYAWTINTINTKIMFVLSIIILFIIFGYKARNTELGIVLFLAIYFFDKSRYSGDVKYVIMFILLCFMVIGIWLLNGFFSPDWNEVSSGRIVVWMERILILENYEPIQLLFGQGYGADIMETTQWWWEAKASHNDFISIVFNSGLFSLILLISIIIVLFKDSTPFQKAMLSFLLITSLTNTGLLGRPIQFLFFCIIFLIAANKNISTKKQTK